MSVSFILCCDFKFDLALCTLVLSARFFSDTHSLPSSVFVVLNFTSCHIHEQCKDTDVFL